MINSKALYLLQSNDFCIQELTLYLDTHPEDRTAAHLLSKHLEIRDELKHAVENEMGPLTNYDHETRDWRWIKGPWPWERGTN
ncbi:MAG: spore coat protein CotJB [Erysipelotrichaceae bacterium]|nr:spore coat protein CotJB [Erysipelotrichaceae bacterium]